MARSPRSSTASGPAASSAPASGPALRTFFNIARAWALSDAESMTLLGFEEGSRSTYFKWKKDPDGARLSRDKLERLSYVFGIYKALQLLLPDPAAADSWIRRPNGAAPFGGRPALDRLLSGNVSDLYVVREYLDAARGW